MDTLFCCRGQEDNTCVYMKDGSEVPRTWTTTKCEETKTYSCQKDEGMTHTEIM